MPQATSPWRVNDVVAFDRMRELAATVYALLQASARAGEPLADAAREELSQWRREVLVVDAYDRAAVGWMASRLEAWVARRRRSVTGDVILDVTADEILRRDILPLYFPDPEPSASPTLTLVAGQPGAGRSRASSGLLRDTGDVAVVNGEDVRALHPTFLSGAPVADSDAATLVARDVAGWVSACIRYAREQRRSVVLEGTFANVAAAMGTAERFAAEGFATRVVVVGSRRAESLLSVTSGHLRDLQAGRPVSLTTRAVHDEGLEATRNLVASLEESAWTDRLTIVDRHGAAVFDAGRSTDTQDFDGAGAALAAAQSARLDRFDATQWLSELHHVTQFAATRRGLPGEVMATLVDLHETSLREVIPQLHVPANGKLATALEQKTVATLVRLRQTAPAPRPIDIAAPVAVPDGPERDGVSR